MDCSPSDKIPGSRMNISISHMEIIPYTSAIANSISRYFRVAAHTIVASCLQAKHRSAKCCSVSLPLCTQPSAFPYLQVLPPATFSFRIEVTTFSADGCPFRWWRSCQEPGQLSSLQNRDNSTFPLHRGVLRFNKGVYMYVYTYKYTHTHIYTYKKFLQRQKFFTGKVSI